MNSQFGKIVIGGVASSVVLWLLMQYNTRTAWLYLVLILLGVLMVYRNVVTEQIAKISALLLKG